MNTATATLLAGTFMIIGQWVQDKPVTARLIIGIIVAALFVSLIGEANPKLGNAFGALLLVSAVIGNAPAIIKRMGYNLG